MSTKSYPDIVTFLKSKGCDVVRDGNRYITHSPIKALQGSIDKTPSFTVFPDGKWKDFSTGLYGDVYKLQEILGGDLGNLPAFQPIITTKQQDWKGQIPSKYLEVSQEEIEKIQAYAGSRGITEGYIPGCYFRPDYSKRLSLLFLHQINGVLSGAKFRALPESLSLGERKCVVRGKCGFYILTHYGTIPSEPTLYLVESESSANSLWMMARKTNRNVVILSHGSVSIIPKSLYEYGTIKDKRLVIDQDGNFELYRTRLEKYSHLDLKPVTLNLPKGEDINSLWSRNESYLIEHLI